MSEVAVEDGLSNLFVGFNVIGPRKIWPSQLGDEGVEVYALTGVEVCGVFEDLPLNRADYSALDLLGVELGPFGSGVSDKDRT